MKYTRYDLKKNNRKNNGIFFIVLICVILILAFLSGTMISNLFIKKPKQNDDFGKKAVQNITEKNNNKNKDKSVREINDFIIIQCGVFANAENANILKEKLKSYGNPFIVKENEKNKVILGIYSVVEFQNIEKLLTQDKIELTKVNIKPDLSSKANLQIAQIIDAQLQILHKFSNNKVKSVQTKQVKDWCSNLEQVDKNEKNYDILNKLKDNIKKLPQEITKEKLEEINSYLYKNIKLLQ
ncbi:SPOR domain-containing protein [Clostridium botulinum]|nr:MULTISPECIES: SPOR domain-containing protein [Clostridium]AYF53299.1 SPOR domain-containing protein [Clostridium novyi]MBO3441881.1 SPOR domain-containing protein [Clostridium haemolyticum]MCD3216120.1 SPOR domain-containing protein [Clostridium botulinum C]MCD3245098.1 SPOR domain-containing protein [Clostridium botulinum C]MCD3260831.1 SPOR domain-containing protein [Clostridium botulinum C]